MRTGSPACPVCRLPITQHERCACGWTLRTSWTVGEGNRSAFAAELAAAQLAHDVRVAAWAGCDRDTIAPLLRGEPTWADWDQAKERPAARTEPLHPVLAAAFASLAAGQVLALVEIGAQDVTITWAAAADPDPGGPPAERRSQPWREVLPMLATDAEHLRFQLAGGLAGVDRAEISVRLAGWAEGLLAASELPADSVLVAVNRCPGWTVPAELIGHLRRCHPKLRAAADAGEVAPVWARVLAEQPLHTSYGLLTADVGKDGTVRLASRPLFAPGDRAGKTATVVVRCPPGGADRDSVLVVVTGTRRLVGAWSVRLRPGVPVPVEAELTAPGRVRLISPADARPDRRSLAQLEALAPGRIHVRSGPVEIICLVELNGPQDAALRRRKLLAELFDLLAAELTVAAGVALLGYTDHYAGAADEHVVHGRWLGPPAAAQETLDALPAPAPRWNRNAAPLEDALQEVARRCAHQPASRPRILLVVAGRPPHPAAVADVPRPAQRCPHGWDWTTYARRLGTAGIGVRLVVLDEPPRPQEDPWRRLGLRVVAPLGSVTAGKLAEAMALVSPNPVRLPFPLADPLQE
ncbi:hypothetical protein [Nonomuraea sp. NPDC049129]|uniref:hypothetical protein n=1 Tax=Nonomuraea sp. NPDC049129 TaxID=3155272 RepID=UPI0033D1875F